MLESFCKGKIHFDACNKLSRCSDTNFLMKEISDIEYLILEFQAPKDQRKFRNDSSEFHLKSELQ